MDITDFERLGSALDALDPRIVREALSEQVRYDKAVRRYLFPKVKRASTGKKKK